MNTLGEINESLKKESVQYYEDYKELKKRFTLERVIIKEEKVTIEEMEEKYRQEKYFPCLYTQPLPADLWY